MRVIDTGANNGFYNMAVDEALFQQAKKQESVLPTLRFYTFQPPAITIGKFQKVEEYRASNFDIVWRPTGGRAVFHNGDLTYSLIISKNDPILGGTITEIYKKVSSIFSLGLSFIGINAELSAPSTSQISPQTTATAGSRKGGMRDPDTAGQSAPTSTLSKTCFSSIARYELQVNGKKILGSAQKIENGVVLQQGSLILHTNPEFQQTGLNEIMGREFTYNEIASAVKEGFIKSGINIKDTFLTTEEQKSAGMLLHKYKTII